MSPANFEAEVRAFATEYPTSNVQRAVALCEAGRLDWADVHEMFRRSLGRALDSVS